VRTSDVLSFCCTPVGILFLNNPDTLHLNQPNAGPKEILLICVRISRELFPANFVILYVVDINFLNY
jgi:hypothetical protein